MKYYLAKTEPQEYSIDSLAKKGTDVWNGVRHPAAVMFLKQMQKGDRVLIYHTGDEKAIVGLAEVVGLVGAEAGRPDPNDTRSWLVDFKFIKKFEPPFVTPKEVRKVKNSQTFAWYV